MLKIFTLLLLFASFLFANIGTVSLVEGKATILRNGQTLGANMGDKIENKDIISTQVNSKIKITFIDNTIVTIGKESSLNIEEYIFNTSTKEAKTELNVLKGAFHTITGEIGKVNPDKFKLKTKSASIGIRGTEFYGDENRIVCTQGRIIVLSNSVSVDVPSGNYINIFPNQRPSVPLPLENSTLDNIIERLNTNNQSSNNGVDNFNNVPSSSLALEGSTLRTLDNLDNQNSWGNWNENLQALQDDKNNAILNNSIQNGINSTDTNNPAVAITDPSYVQSLMDAANPIQLSFSGTISSTELNPGETIINNSISLDIYLGRGSNSVAGSYNFSTNQLRNYSGTFVNNTVNKDGFWASDPSDSSINGKFYGQNISSVRGTINMQDPGVSSLSGTFSATR
ncbi:FecR family protein [Aliarcobacter butzleri]|uniref:FecR family protein n=1 Tax=Aliarcobacter butzleri TaxID=28197 RepID=UPI00125FF4B6|nr:FecR family protein [Aliarcobacter butzleri]MCT7593667.1 FecR family protein [Aliarcobacter butzleri]MCT7598577.1 FecR family protein [Aliarcobacter butzleri]MCT7652237.1 FecR family protein [Aliarcobacter butzleri]